MNKLKLSLVLLSTLTFILSFGQDSIPNANFEYWNTSTSPAGWHTVDEILPFGFNTCYKTSFSYNGDFAIQLKTIHMDSVPIPGVMTLGTVGMGYTSGGIGFSNKPIALKGYYIHPTQGDEVMVIAQFFKDGNEIGSGFWSTSDSVAEFTEFSATVFFQSMEMPDTLNITILTDQNTIGSSLVLDALEFEYTATDISKHKDAHLHVYPNPCNNQIFLDLPSNVRAEIEIFDMSGRMVLHQNGLINPVNTTPLKQGIYSLILKTDAMVYQQKLIKQ